MRPVVPVILALLGLLAALVAAAVVSSPPGQPPQLTATPEPTGAIGSPSPQVSPTITAPGTTSPTATTGASPTTTPPGSEQRGTITGRLAYPSEFIPPLTVYAIRTDGGGHVSVDTPRYPLESGPTPPQPTYTISGVPPGTYVVLGYRNDEDPNADRPGVYSEYVLCGLRAGCEDHSLVEVMVGPGEIVTDVDVSDWYYPQDQQYPPRPE